MHSALTKATQLSVSYEKRNTNLSVEGNEEKFDKNEEMIEREV
jgi:hypothetical protein